MKVLKIFSVIIITALIALAFNPKVVQELKSVFAKGHPEIVQDARFSFEYGSNMSFAGFEGGIAIYNGRSIAAFDRAGKKLFNMDWRTSDFDIKGFEDKIVFLDRIKRSVVIIDKKGNKVKQINFVEKPLIVEPFEKDMFIVHYVYDLNDKAEGIRVFSGQGKQVKDIQISDVSILLIQAESVSKGFIVSGISVDDDRLYNNVMHYDKSGDLIRADRVENKIFKGIIHMKDRFIMWEENYMEIRDSDLKYLKSIYSDSSILGVQDMGDSFAVADESNSIRTYSYDGTEKEVYKCNEKLKGVLESKDGCIFYTQRIIEFLEEGKDSIAIKNDILDVMRMDKSSIAVICKGEVRIFLVE